MSQFHLGPSNEKAIKEAQTKLEEILPKNEQQKDVENAKKAKQITDERPAQPPVKTSVLEACLVHLNKIKISIIQSARPIP